MSAGPFVPHVAIASGAPGASASAPEAMRFRILSTLGGGGMGEVFRAWDGERGAEVALKVVRTPDADELLRFKREFRAVADIRHENIAALGELFEDEGRWFFTMELVRGHDPLVWIGRNAARLRHAIAGIARGLQALHAHGVVHRDIKPANILITDERRVVILDFGVALSVGARDLPAIVGTPLYMAPEQMDPSTTVGPAADCYALGVLMYVALTGRRPFQATTAQRLFLEKRDREPTDVAQLQPDAPPDLVELCHGLLRKSPEARPGTDEILRVVAEHATAGDAAEASSSTRATKVTTNVATNNPAAMPGELFVGRGAELARLHDLAQATRDGQARVVVISAEPGMGKSELVRHFAQERARRPASLVAFGRCYERESVPFKGIDGLIDAIYVELVALDEVTRASVLPADFALLATTFPVLQKLTGSAPEAPVLAPVLALDLALAATLPTATRGGPVEESPLASQERRHRVFGAVRELLLRLTAVADVLLVIDDMQWADDDSLAALAEVFRAPEAPPVLLVATARTAGARGTSSASGASSESGASERDDVIARISAHVASIVEITLGPLDDADARRIVHLVGAAGVDADAAAREARGHPLLLLELARGTSATRVDDAIRERAGKLDDVARALLEVSAVAGVPLDEARVTEASPDGTPPLVDVDGGAPRARVADAIAALRAARLLRTTASSFETYHDRVREAVVDALTAERRRAIHARLAAHFERIGALPERVVAQLREAGDTQRAAQLAITAARHARDALAVARAAELYREALAIRGNDATLLTELGDVLTSAGRGAEAAAAYLTAAGDGDDELSSERRRRGGEELLRAGHFAEGRRVLERLIAPFGFAMPKSTATTLLGLAARELQLRVRGTKHRATRAVDVDRAVLRRIDVCWTAAMGLAGKDNFASAYFQARHMLLALDAGEPWRISRALSLQAGFFRRCKWGALTSNLSSSSSELTSSRSSVATRAPSRSTCG